METPLDILIIGGGQSGLACGYFLRRTSLNFQIVDAGEYPGGAWLHGWDSLTLFSPAESSTLPGWPMPKSQHPFPLRSEVISYLTEYEKRYQLSVKYGVTVVSLHKDGALFRAETNEGAIYARAVISATGTWGKPFIPAIEGLNEFEGVQLHSAKYRNPAPFRGKRVLVVGEGNSGAQIFAELQEVCEAAWATREEPQFLPDDVDGRVIFNMASAKYLAQKEGRPFDASKYSLGNVVMVPPVKAARDKGVLKSRGRLRSLTSNGVLWENGKAEVFDAIIWCTGFGFSTDHLRPLLNPDERGKVPTQETRSLEVPGLWLVGYGNWTGYASATLIGVGRTARVAVAEVEAYLKTGI